MFLQFLLRNIARRFYPKFELLFVPRWSTPCKIMRSWLPWYAIVCLDLPHNCHMMRKVWRNFECRKSHCDSSQWNSLFPKKHLLTNSSWYCVNYLSTSQFTTQCRKNGSFWSGIVHRNIPRSTITSEVHLLIHLERVSFKNRKKPLVYLSRLKQTKPRWSAVHQPYHVCANFLCRHPS